MGVTVEQREHVLLIGLDWPEKRNAFDVALLNDLAAAYGRLEDDPDAWVDVLFAHGDHFTAGLDLAKIAGRIISGRPAYDVGDAIDPWGLVGRPRLRSGRRERGIMKIRAVQMPVG